MLSQLYILHKLSGEGLKSSLLFKPRVLSLINEMGEFYFISLYSVSLFAVSSIQFSLFHVLVRFLYLLR
jgi:hypothetical protein